MKKIAKLTLAVLPTIVVIVAAAYLYISITTDATVEQLLLENAQLKEAISNITAEENIGYAKVVSQEYRQDKLYTRILFVETDPQDTAKHIYREEFEIEGDVVHFDAMVVKFSAELVADGKERAMYIWRRAYGEALAPQEGITLHKAGEPSPRYEQAFKKLSIKDRQLFWEEIWKLSDNPSRLEKQGITAVFGNVVYKKLRPGVMYVFKASPTGGIHPETIPLI